MQITIIAGGSRGDVQPYVALGKGLQEAGHTVRILTSDDFQTLVTDNGLDFFTTGGQCGSRRTRDANALRARQNAQNPLRDETCLRKAGGSGC